MYALGKLGQEGKPDVLPSCSLPQPATAPDCAGPSTLWEAGPWDGDAPNGSPWFARIKKGGYSQCVEKRGEPGLGIGRQAGDVWQLETGSERDGCQSGGGCEWP